MKTDKEAAEEFSGKNWKTMGHENIIDVIHDTFLAGCKHKEESRWIPVRIYPEKDMCAWVNDTHLGVQKCWYSKYNDNFVNSAGLTMHSVTHYQPIIIPTPPQTNK